MFQGVRQHDSHTVVEFYAVDSRSGEVLNATDAYYLLTEEGQDYHLMGFHVIQVEMKGACVCACVCATACLCACACVCMCMCVALYVYMRMHVCICMCV